MKTPSQAQTQIPTQAQAQAQTPLLSRLLTCAERQTAPFHTPGHHGKGICAELRSVWGEALFATDLPELPELDNLFAPEAVIAEAQALAAEAFGSDRTFFLVNGSTAGVMAAILATCGPGDKILLPRTVHRSAIAGLILSGAKPVFIRPEICPRTGLVGNVSVEAIAQALEQHPDLKAVLLVSPTYEGICAEVEIIAQLCHRHNIPLLVDEAHGPHFGFHPNLPRSAMGQGADLSVQSIHKVLSGLTQSAMLHLGHQSLVPGDRIAQSLQLVQSTSPSYLLLASLDAARMQMATQGHELMARALTLAKTARDRLSNLSGLQVFELLQKPQPGFAQLDSTRLTVDVRGLGMTGFEVDEILNETYGVIAELPTLHNLTFIISLGNKAEDIEQLVQAFAALVARAFSAISLNPDPASDPPTDPDLGSDSTTSESPHHLLSLPLLMEPILSPRKAHFAGSQTIALERAVGHVSAETVCPYPPGIPVLLPGEMIEAEAIAHLQSIQACGGVISGASDPTLATLRIVNQGSHPITSVEAFSKPLGDCQS